MTRLTFGSLFAGIGGLDLGLERAGMECAWQVELDDYCTRILEKHWPGVTKHKDVRDVGKHNLEPVDLIAGGFPCQPHSVAGKRKGAADDRNLWPEFIRVVREKKSRYVLAENVLGIVTTYLDTVLSDLEGEGYTCWTFNLPACGFDAPHRRERIFVVAYANGTWKLQPQGSKSNKRRRVSNEGEDVADTKRTRQQGQGKSINASDTEESGEGQAVDVVNGGFQSVWSVEPNVGRVAHGVPSRVDRLRGLGNAVVPQVAEWIGKRIVEYDSLIAS